MSADYTSRMAAHFSPKTLKFLKELEKHNDREWFGARKDVYESELKAPLLELIGKVNEGFEGFAPEFIRDPAKCALRIYRDIRFSKNKQPYKTNLAAWWSAPGMEKTSGGGFYFELNTREIVCASGVYMPGKDQLLAIRRMLVEDHEKVRAAMNVKGTEAIERLKLTRAPKGFAPDSPGLDLILQRQWGVLARLPVETALSPTLARQVVARFRAAAPLVELLNAPLRAAARPKPMF